MDRGERDRQGHHFSRMDIGIDIVGRFLVVRPGRLVGDGHDPDRPSLATHPDALAGRQPRVSRYPAPNELGHQVKRVVAIGTPLRRRCEIVQIREIRLIHDLEIFQPVKAIQHILR